MLRKIIYLLFFALLIPPLFSQINKGDKCYDKFQFIKAISYYKKATNSNTNEKQKAYIKLGDSYKKINDYSNSEIAYRNALAINAPVPAEVHYNYSQFLKKNNKYQEAVEQYTN
jgi:tetratricopeptide (TPR) repeat protein